MRSIVLNLQLACKKKQGLPKKKDFLRWVQCAVSSCYHQKNSKEITVRIVDKAESRILAMIYLGKNQPTNVLSFHFTAPPEIKSSLLGDLVICRQVVEFEARQQKKKLESHWAHMTIHGSLHLLGFNHILDREVLTMESLEIKIMHKLGYLNPY
ncbi:rRNA maturation RNase YbeY [Sodalis sp. CWE]|uniref:rRNA maturation RNase YbeY n=1 Tax=Sodalis sp. CWE TaxID=2803816 RepID=UPI001C7DEA6A|nr:rRNA maturation RNase YbeY [Sodalis sp. CWE]MBX4180933.1 rRNA maturation RNase YbeY [Sodalis sp. CWE]